MLDRISEYLSRRKGLLPIIGIVFVLFNFVIQLVLPLSSLASTNFLLHLGVVIAILGWLLARAL